MMRELSYFVSRLSRIVRNLQCRTQGGPEAHVPPEEAESALKNFFCHVLLKEKVRGHG